MMVVMMVMVMMPSGGICRSRCTVEGIDRRQGTMQSSENGSFFFRLMAVVVVAIGIG